jgi:DNA modification methylase
MTPYYEQSGVTIYHGDCRDVLPSLSVGLILTDPPYGVAHKSNHGATWAGSQIANDVDTTARDDMLRLCAGRPAVVFGSWKAPRPLGLRAVLIWDKGPASGMGDLAFPWKNSFEEIYILGDGWAGPARDEGVIRGHVMVTWESMGRQHPNQKPEGLMLYFLARHQATPVLDPFMGSGTTLVAAKRLGRLAIGIEIDERYCEIAARRLAQEALPLEMGA